MKLDWEHGKWEVFVGNVGAVHTGNLKSFAYECYNDYVQLSRDGYGRCAGESVQLFNDGRLTEEYLGLVDEPDAD